MYEEQNEKDDENRDILKEIVKDKWNEYLETPEGQAMAEFIAESIQPLIDMISAIINELKPVIELVAKAFGKFAEIKEKAFANCSKKVKHLALHGKKERTRNKNWNRIWKEYFKGVRHGEGLDWQPT